MSTSDKNLSDFKNLPDGKGLRIGIVVSLWNDKITEAMFNAACDILKKSGVDEKDIIRKNVPGSFELPFGAKSLLTFTKTDAIICIGCIIQGETRHFEFISNAVANGIMQLGLVQTTPVIFGVLTTDSMQQAIDRSGGKHGNKGIEAAISALQMAELKKSNLKNLPIGFVPPPIS